ncbi:MAG: RluA family pseudouridine synthase [Bacillota bacterium]|nr:RluA family pseudouridine synthase [Bacillota bacterium]
MQKNIIYEDDHIIVVYKPAGIATQTARLGQRDMVSELKNYLAKKPEYKGKGEPYLGLVHRLDQPVSGILVFAKNKNAAAELSRQVTNGQMQKHYYAVVLGVPEEKEGKLENYLYKDGKTNQSLVVREGFPGAKKAVLKYRVVTTLAVLEENGVHKKSAVYASSKEVSLVEIQLITGRHHQIRAQFSYAGYPLLGDGKYGNEKSKLLSRQAGCKNTALCAYKLAFIHPISQKEMVFERQPENEIFLPFFTRGI